MREVRPLLPLFRRHAAWLWAGGLLALLTLASSVALLALSGWFITAAGLAGLSAAVAISFDIFSPGAGVRLFAMSRTGGRYAERLATHEATFRVLAEVRGWLFARLIPLSPLQLGTLRGGDLLSRLTGDVDALDGLYLRVLIPLAVAAGGAALTVGLLWALVEGTVALAVGGLLAVGVIGVPLLAVRRGLRAGAAVTLEQAEVRTALLDALAGVAELRAFGADGRQRGVIALRDNALRDAQRRVSRLNGLAGASTLFLSGLAAWSALLLGGLLVEAGRLDGPLMVLGVLAALAAFEAVAPVAGASHALGRLLAAARRITSLAEQPPLVAAPLAPAIPPPADAPLVFENVSFRYRANGPEVLAGIDLALTPGKRIALIGESGAGKSTLAALALRRLDPTGGRVSLGGVDLRSLHPAVVHSRIAWLSQRGHVFADTLRANLLLAAPDAASDAAPDARDDRLWHVLDQAGLADTVRRLPDGLDTWAGEGGMRLSGGQARRLLLARVLLQDAPYVLLDEPTEGLDAITAERVMDRVLTVTEGKGLLLITHQTFGLKRMDVVASMEDGRITITNINNLQQFA